MQTDLHQGLFHSYINILPFLLKLSISKYAVFESYSLMQKIDPYF